MSNTANESTQQKQKKPLKYRVLDIIGIILCILLLPMVIINMTMAIQSVTQPDVPPNFMGYTPLIVTSGSMTPSFDVKQNRWLYAHVGQWHPSRCNCSQSSC